MNLEILRVGVIALCLSACGGAASAAHSDPDAGPHDAPSDAGTRFLGPERWLEAPFEADAFGGHIAYEPQVVPTGNGFRVAWRETFEETGTGRILGPGEKPTSGDAGAWWTADLDRAGQLVRGPSPVDLAALEPGPAWDVDTVRAVLGSRIACETTTPADAVRCMRVATAGDQLLGMKSVEVLGPQGVILTTAPIPNSTGLTLGVSLAWTGTTYFVLWSELRITQPYVEVTGTYGSRVDPDGVLLDRVAVDLGWSGMSSLPVEPRQAWGPRGGIVGCFRIELTPGITVTSLDTSAIPYGACGYPVAGDSADWLVSADFRASRVGPGGAVEPAVDLSSGDEVTDSTAACVGDDCIVLWATSQGGLEAALGSAGWSDTDIRALKFRSDQVPPAASPFSVGGEVPAHRGQAVARGKDGYLVVWEDGRISPSGVRGIYAMPVALDGVPQEPARLVSDPAFTSCAPGVATNGERYLVVWWQHEPSGPYSTDGAIVGMVVDPSGLSLQDAPSLLFSGIGGPRSWPPAIASHGASFLVVLPGKDRSLAVPVGADGTVGSAVELTDTIGYLASGEQGFVGAGILGDGSHRLVILALRDDGTPLHAEPWIGPPGYGCQPIWTGASYHCRVCDEAGNGQVIELSSEGLPVGAPRSVACPPAGPTGSSPQERHAVPDGFVGFSWVDDDPDHWGEAWQVAHMTAALDAVATQRVSAHEHVSGEPASAVAPDGTGLLAYGVFDPTPSVQTWRTVVRTIDVRGPSTP